MNQGLMVALVALLPLTALVTVLQKRPFYALISRGMMGAVATLIYAVMGAPDVALTEALMGTLLTIVLYLIAVRSSMVIKIGWLEEGETRPAENGSACDPRFEPIRRCCHSHFLEPEFIRFTDRAAIGDALAKGLIHAVFGQSEVDGRREEAGQDRIRKPYVLRLPGGGGSLPGLFQHYFREGEVEIEVFTLRPKKEFETR